MSLTFHGTNGITFNDGTIINSAKQSAFSWLRFDGSGAITIQASLNVSSVVDRGNGLYTVVFLNPAPSSAYAVVCSHNTLANVANNYTQAYNFTVNGYNIDHGENGANVDAIISACAFR